MKAEIDFNIHNLFSLYNLIGQNVNDAILINTDLFSIISSNESIWPNIVFNLNINFDGKEFNEKYFHLLNKENKNHLIICDNNAREKDNLKELGYIHVDSWIGMHRELDSLIEEIHFSPEGENIIIANENLKYLDQWVSIVSKEIFNGEPLSINLFKNLVNTGKCSLIGFLKNDTIIGSAMIYYDENGFAGIYMVAVDKGFRRLGIGLNILEFTLSYLKDKKANKVFLQSTKPGYPLYKKLGFEKDNIYNLYKLK
jgi:ribosomal protein S18 acetylase RimI-like enzyme